MKKLVVIFFSLVIHSTLSLHAYIFCTPGVNAAALNLVTLLRNELASEELREMLENEKTLRLQGLIYLIKHAEIYLAEQKVHLPQIYDGLQLLYKKIFNVFLIQNELEFAEKESDTILVCFENLFNYAHCWYDSDKEMSYYPFREPLVSFIINFSSKEDESTAFQGSRKQKFRQLYKKQLEALCIFEERLHSSIQKLESAPAILKTIMIDQKLAFLLKNFFAYDGKKYLKEKTELKDRTVDVCALTALIAACAGLFYITVVAILEYKYNLERAMLKFTIDQYQGLLKTIGGSLFGGLANVITLLAAMPDKPTDVHYHLFQGTSEFLRRQLPIPNSVPDPVIGIPIPSAMYSSSSSDDE